MKVDPLLEPLLAGDRRALAQAITLIESTRSDHRERADALLGALLPHAGKSVRLGITGVPGVGKSTFIERFGLSLLEQGRSLAVLAIDPSSKRGGGSILGDKTRMEELSRRHGAFIRPSPAGATLGGVARRTRETMLLVEAAGFDTVIVETVGVGQSETAVSDMVDMFIVLLLPAGGDDLQGIKRGVIELADLIVVNKADGDLLATARRSASDYQHALRMLRSPTAGWTPEVTTASALTGEGVAEVWQVIGRFMKAVGEKGVARRRADQARAWMWNEVGETLLAELRKHPGVKKLVVGPGARGRSRPRNPRRRGPSYARGIPWPLSPSSVAPAAPLPSRSCRSGSARRLPRCPSRSGSPSATAAACAASTSSNTRAPASSPRPTPAASFWTPRRRAAGTTRTARRSCRTASSSPQRWWPRWTGCPRPVATGWSTSSRTSTGGTPWSPATRKPCMQAGISARGRVIPEDQVEDISERVVDWFA